MASVSLFSSQSASSTSLWASTEAQQTQAQTQQSTAATSSEQETVKLSEKAQAKLLHQQGQSVAAIAATLGTTTDSINEDLNITVDEALQKTLEQAVQSTASA